MSDFSPHGYEVIGSIAPDIHQFQTLYGKALISVRWFLIVMVQQNWSVYSGRIMRFSVLMYASLHDGPPLSYQNCDSLYCCSFAGACTGIDLWVYCLLSSMQFCDTSNVSDLIFQCAFSHADFQVLQFYVINCYNPQWVLFCIKYFPRFR